MTAISQGDKQLEIERFEYSSVVIAFIEDNDFRSFFPSKIENKKSLVGI